MFTLIVPTHDLKGYYESGDFGPLHLYYSFEDMISTVLSAGAFHGQIHQLLQDKLPETGDAQEDFRLANIIVVMVELFTEDLQQAIADAMRNYPVRYYYGLVNFVHAGILIGISDKCEDGLVFEGHPGGSANQSNYGELEQGVAASAVNAFGVAIRHMAYQMYRDSGFQPAPVVTIPEENVGATNTEPPLFANISF